ncbi:SLC13 family permease [Celeribacter indicus]|uniref:Citrate transporter n=1 Tax=Celeribacter indicus TaxID=1208324 RepID=A0A0B5DT76_9RHOB|nr:SLC13 family permease [Celeribacter indicus]AJE46254.1 citrate transporter [Celeribacter indicus]SDW51251.1 TrkA-C domain-containing protein [Celeribacter indicus]
MTSELASVLGLLLVALLLFAWGRPRMDVVALLLIVTLPFTGAISVSETLQGFADPSVVLIAALFVVGEALVRTGVAQWIGDQLSRRSGGREGPLIVMLMLSAAGLSAFMSSTGVVAIFVPIVLRIARTAHLSPGRLMMPLSMAALISGMLTLVATPPNMVLNAELIRQGHDGFGFFAFSVFGLPVLALAILYMLAMRRRLAPAAGPAEARAHRPHIADLLETYALTERVARLAIPAASDFVGQRLDTLGLHARLGITLFAIERRGRLGTELLLPEGDREFAAGDCLILLVPEEDFDLDAFATRHRLIRRSAAEVAARMPSREIGLVEAMVPPGSAHADLSPVEAQFRSTIGLSVLGLRRAQNAATSSVAETRLKPGDTLLLSGPWRTIRRLQGQRRDLVFLDLPEEAEDFVPERRRAPVAIAVLGAIVLAMTFGLLPNAQIALIGCLALGAFGCIDLRSAYRAVNWQMLVLIAGMIPFALALERTGGVDLAAQAVVSLFGDGPPRLLLAALFAATTLLSLFISNTATAVLMGPVALAIADSLGASPYPFVMCVALAASTAFMTPVSSPVNLLVLTPGGYRFGDFVRIGTPFTLVTLAFCVTLLPVVLPL